MKKEILIIPFFGWAISRLKPISINRKLKVESLKKVIEVGGARIKEGYAVLVFPEGTRKKPEDGIGKFGNSCGLLASNEMVPIIPICHNSGKYWINRSFKKKIYQNIKITMVHGAKDKSVPINYSRKVLKIFPKAKKKLIIVKKGDHSLSNKKWLNIILKELKLLIN